MRLYLQIKSLMNDRKRRSAKLNRKARGLRLEQMEARMLMAADIASTDHYPLQERRFDSAWFQRITPTADGISAKPAESSIENLTWKGREVKAVAHEWIVQFNRGQSLDTASQVKSFFTNSMVNVQVVGGLGSAGQVLVQTPGMSTEAVLQWMSTLPQIDYFEPNMLSDEQRIPNDPQFNNLSGLRNSIDQDIDAEQAWDVTTGNKNVVIGVLDSGIDYRHPDLAANIWRNPGEVAGDGIDNDRNGFVDDIHGFDFVNWDSDPMDRNGHGTHVSGTIAAVGNNGRGISGVAWNASIMAIQILNDDNRGTSFSNIVSALNYATMMRVDYGVNVRATNNSWGGGGYSQALSDAIARSGQADILFVAAAGNNNTNNDAFPFYPASYNAPNIISVAAVDSAGNYAGFSNFGTSSVDIAAPGVNILSTLPGNRYGYYNGTSMAAPHVTGSIALAVAANPELGSAQLKQLVLGSGDRLVSRTKTTLTNARVNANNMVLGAKSTVGEPDRFGVWRPQGGWFFADTGAPGFNGEKPVQFGLPGDIPIAGDWDGDGRDTIGVYRPNGGLFFLDVNRPGYTGEGAFQFGLPGDLPVAGDWNGDGIDDVGVFRPNGGLFFLDAGPRGYNGEAPFQFGLAGDRPIAGDWNGDGKDDVGVYRANGRAFFLDDAKRGYNGELPFVFNGPGDIPFAGDWDRDGRDNIGMFVSNGGYAILDTGPRGYNGEAPIQFGLNGDYPLSGIWNPAVTINRSTAASTPGVSGMRAAGFSTTINENVCYPGINADLLTTQSPSSINSSVQLQQLPMEMNHSGFDSIYAELGDLQSKADDFEGSFDGTSSVDMAFLQFNDQFQEEFDYLRKIMRREAVRA